MDKARAFSAYKEFLRESGKTRAQLLQLAADLESGIEDVTLLTVSTEGSSSSGMKSDLTREARFAAVMEVIAEGTGGRQLMAFPDYRHFHSQT
jgi:hypothetical protein